jgi:RNA polymerase sigma-70 factor (ECF subfamily)
VGEPGELLPRDFASWYAACHGRVLAGVRVATRDSQLAGDAVSEAFTRAFARWERVAVMERPEAWVYTVAMNVVRRGGRRAGTERRLLRRIGARELDVPAAHESEPELWAAVDALPPRQREAVALRYALGFSQREVARAMGTSDGTAASTLAKARAALAQRLGVTEEVAHD